MHFLNTPYIWLLLTSASIAAVLTVHAWRRRNTGGGKPLVAILLAIVLWNLANALEITSPAMPAKVFWANLQYLSIVVLPVAWLVLVLEYTGRSGGLGRRLPWLMLVPALTLLLVWTNDLHGLIRQRAFLYRLGPLVLVGKTYGAWFWVHAGYSYLLLLGSALLGRSLSSVNPFFRRQSLILLGALVLPLTGNLLYITNLIPAYRIDPTPILFGLSGLIAAWGLFRYRLFDLVPVARTVVLESMYDGVIVLDAQGRIQDVNPAAQRILGRRTAETIGRPAREVCQPWPDLAAVCAGTTEFAETELGEDDPPRFYDLHCSALPNLRGRPSGRVVILHEITEQRETQRRLAAQQRAMGVLEERERLARELHDNVAQVLGFVKMRAQTARDLLAGGRREETDEILARLVGAAHEAQEEIRVYLQWLRDEPAAGDFLASLEAVLRRFEENYGIATELEMAGDFDEYALPPGAGAQILRIVREILANTWKHAGTDRLRLAIRVGDGAASIVAADDGRGFDPAGVAARDGHGLGLAIMRERAGEAGGTLEVQSAPGQGTRVIVRFPLSPERIEAAR